MEVKNINKIYQAKNQFINDQINENENEMMSNNEEDIQNNNGNDNINTPTAESDIADDEVMVSDDDIV